MYHQYHYPKDKCIHHLIPMKNEENCNLFEDCKSATWVWFNDGKKHGRVPTIVGHGLEDIWGGEDNVRRHGYTKHWCVFEDTTTGKCYFGNYPSFIRSKDPDDVQAALGMLEVDIATLELL